MMESTVARIIGALRTERQQQMEDTMNFPRSEPFEHGVQIGAFQGLGKALEVIDSVLNDMDKEEKRR